MAYNIFNWPDEEDKSLTYVKGVGYVNTSQLNNQQGSLPSLKPEENVDDIPFDTEKIFQNKFSFDGGPPEKLTVSQFRMTPKAGAVTRTTSSPAGSSPSIITKNYADTIPGSNKFSTPEDAPTAPTDSSLTAGDIVGLGSMIGGSTLQLLNTISNELTSKKPENTFLTYAQDSLKTLHGGQMFAQRMLDEAFATIGMQENTAGRAMVQNARGIQSQRAVQFGLHAQGQEARRKARAGYAAQMLGLNREIAATELRRDAMVMGAEERKNIADQQDHDTFYSNISRNLADFTTTGETIARNMNINETNRLSANLINQLSKYGLKLDDDGNIIYK